MIAHSVYFTLKDRSPEAAAALVASCREHLTGHPGEVAFSVGTVAPFDRQVNDRDWDVMLLVVFATVAAHYAYQTAPRHEQFIADNALGWAKVRVFDAEVAAFTAADSPP